MAVLRAVREREELYEVEGGVDSGTLMMALTMTFRGGIGRSAALPSVADPCAPVTIRLDGAEDEGSTALSPDLNVR